MTPFSADPSPSEILRSIPEAVYHRSRVSRPAVREGWLVNPGSRSRARRGRDRFVEVSWDAAIDLVASELKRIISEHGNSAIFGGSYGWSSAGRFHHAKSQLQRFLSAIGGYTGAVNTYSNAGGTVITERVLGDSKAMNGPCTSWRSIIDHCEFIVMFGGMPLRNTQVTSGGLGEHTTEANLRAARAAGIEFCSISPIQDDTPAFLEAEWLAPRPNTDTALILGVCHTLQAEGLHDRNFLARYCIGYEIFEGYLVGQADGKPKTAEWAAEICEVPPETIRSLARRMASRRTMLTMTWSLQRAHHGEQACWALITLASMLGQVGLPGTGFGFAYGSIEGVGLGPTGAPTPALRALPNPVRSFIPVARIADLLLHPGERFDYNGQSLVYPDIRAIYWSGGNPFHHHQDLNRLIRGWRRPDTIIVNECWWTATARHADIVLPATTSLERNDIGATSRDRYIIAMKQAIAPVGEARNDFDIFAELAERFGVRERFTEGREEMEFVRHLYDTAREAARKQQQHWPAFDDFWERGFMVHNVTEEKHVLYGDFRRDPDRFPLSTPSGRIEIFSETLASFGYADCAGHAMWFEPREWLGSASASTYPLHMLTTQPAARLHSQLDMGPASQNLKVGGREPIRINPEDAAARGVADGSLVEVYNHRGAMLAVACCSPSIRRGVVQIPTGAWYDPADPEQEGSLEKHGNPNVLTIDEGTSKLAQGPSAQSTLVEVRPFRESPPPITAYEVPLFAPSQA